MKQDTFCILPFIAVNTDTNGAINVCCKNTYHTLGNGRNGKIEEMWNCTQLKELRKAFLNGDRHPSCVKCWRFEDVGGNSYRHDVNRYYERFKDRALQLVNSETGEMPFEVKFLEIKLSSLCNLACKMCIPQVSTTLASVWDSTMTQILHRQHVIETTTVQETFSSLDVLLTDLKRLAPTLSVLSIAGGEPLMDERFVDVFSTLGEYRQDIELSIITNLSKLKHGRFDIIPELNQFKRVVLVVSIDGTPKVTEYIRTFSNAENVKSNLFAIKQRVPNIFVSVNSTVSALNVLDYVEAVKYYVNVLGVDLITYSNVDNFHLSVNILPFPVREKAISKIDSFLKTDLFQLLCSTELREQIEKQSIATINLLKNPYRDQQGWEEFKQYIHHFDQKCNSDVFNIVPELEEYWNV